MSINEFNIQSNSSKSNPFNRIIIPNNQTTTTDDFTATTHKTKSLIISVVLILENLSQISGKITNLANTQHLTPLEDL